MSGRRELGQFLRTRRERLSPEEFGITASPSRRTPGLRREEVAFLANIGVKWYASLEAGEETHPSPKTLLAVARALRLSRIDTNYVFGLAGLSAPGDRATDYTFEVPWQVELLVRGVRRTAASVWDSLLTPLAWNAIFDAVMGCSEHAAALERNILVQAFGSSGFIQQMTGSDFGRVITNAVGMLRRYYTSGEPAPFAREVYERIKGSPEFQQIWDAHTVADELQPGAIITRNHPTLGALRLNPLDLYLHYREDIVVKLWFPADAATTKTFDDLQAAADAGNGAGAAFASAGASAP